MARDKAKDDKLFNCSQDYELDYVAGLYVERKKVRDFLVRSCQNNSIKNMTHMQVYKLIQKELGYPLP